MHSGLHQCADVQVCGQWAALREHLQEAGDAVTLPHAPCIFSAAAAAAHCSRLVAGNSAWDNIKKLAMLPVLLHAYEHQLTSALLLPLVMAQAGSG
jgi:hypothetical protein